MRVLVFHGYLLRGTGSNVYNASLVAALVRLGHQVDLLCQDRHADEFDFVGAVADWDSGELSCARSVPPERRCIAPRSAACSRCTWPTQYEDIEARPFSGTER